MPEMEEKDNQNGEGPLQSDKYTYRVIWGGGIKNTWGFARSFSVAQPSCRYRSRSPLLESNEARRYGALRYVASRRKIPEPLVARRPFKVNIAVRVPHDAIVSLRWKPRARCIAEPNGSATACT